MTKNNSYSGILFIGDSVISRSRPGRRIDEDYFETAIGKLKFSLNYAKENNLKPIIVGNLCRKKFEVTSYARLISELSGNNVTLIAGSNEYIGASSTINPHSQAALLEKSGVIDLCSSPEVIQRISIIQNGKEKKIAIYGVPEKQSAPKSLGVQEGIKNDEEGIIVRKSKSFEFESEDGTGEIEIEVKDWEGCSLFVSDNGPFEKGITSSNKTNWLNTGPLVRNNIAQDGNAPIIWKYAENGLEEVLVPHEKHVFDLEGFASQSVKDEYKSSEFTKMLKEATSRTNQEMPENFIKSEIASIYEEEGSSLEAREVVESLIDFTSNPSSALEGIF